MKRLFPVGHIVDSLPYAIVFKTTHWCWNNCPHCCESAGADMPKKFIPYDTIENYVIQAKNDPKFDKNIVLTGGEITSAYMHHSPDYVPKLLNMALDNKCMVDIKTNAGWAIAKNNLRNQIFNDLVGVLSAHSVSSFRITPLQISLSLDRFHPHALKKNTEFITELSRRQKNSLCLVHVSSFPQDADLFQQLLDNLRDKKCKLEQLMAFDNNPANTPNTIWSVNGKVLLKFSVGTLFDGGRAANIAGAYHTPAPQFTFITDAQNPTVLMAFDSFGNVTLGENSGRKITTQWQDKNGNARPLADIRRDIVRQTRIEEIRYTFETIALTNKAIKEKIKNAFSGLAMKKR